MLPDESSSINNSDRSQSKNMREGRREEEHNASSYTLHTLVIACLGAGNKGNYLISLLVEAISGLRKN